MAASAGPSSSADHTSDQVRTGARRVSFVQREDGSIDIGAMHTSTIEKVRRAFASDRTQRELGLSPEMTGSLGLPDFVGSALVEGVSTLVKLLIVKTTGAPRAIVESDGGFSDAERAALEPVILKVANKYGASVLAKYGDECALVVLLTTITTSKIAAVKDAIARRPRPTPIATEPERAIS